MAEKPTMTLAERTAVHQIHPVKLATDIGVTFPSLYFFWQHQLLLGFIVALVPAAFVSALVIRFVDLEPYRQSPFGRYFLRYMASSAISAVRLFGFLVMSAGAWLHVSWLIVLGVVIVLIAWLRGLIFPRSTVGIGS